ncbi:succinylglutamate desuccinylase/aspartoacylase family protein [Congregibacter variabilis]|uniref:Succinylglutamate desuccinylase/aspartoacylase family protein n=1 Tax=Congregibacter variabilis TaxID=3081200 RepID=A0ABZ0I6J3_9GAMM|nr:succinylglutamate desuccinylase/aspartoacylase family protein [Congregibacter sp. IMCC43200]
MAAGLIEISAAQNPVEIDDGASQTTQISDAKSLSPRAKPAKNVDLKEVVSDPADLAPAPAEAEPQETLLELPDISTETVNESLESTQDLAPEAPDDDVGASLNTGASTQQFQDTETGSPGSDPGKRQLILLGAEVLPGTTTRLAWSPSVSFLGISAPTSVLVVNGAKPGPQLCLTAALHGDEINGIETVRRVLYEIDAEDLSGAIIGVPIVNLQGFRAGSRYLADRRDLNRFFPGNLNGSAASRIAFSFFQEIISQCDMLIDLHTGSFRRTNLPQLRADLSYPAIQSLADTMGRIVVLQSKGAKGSLRRAASESGIPSVTLEAGAPNELNENAVEDSVASVRAALRGLGMTDTLKSRKRSDAPIYYQSTWVRASEGGILISEVKLGAKVKLDQVLGAVINPITNQNSKIISPANGRVIGMALNQVMHPGFAAYHLGIDPTAELAAIPNSSVQASDILIEPADDEDPDNDQNVVPNSAEQTTLKNTDHLLINEILEEGESGR